MLAIPSPIKSFRLISFKLDLGRKVITCQKQRESSERETEKENSIQKRRRDENIIFAAKRCQRSRRQLEARGDR